MKVGILQLNPWINDIEGNALKIEQGAKEAFAKGAQIVITSELALLGYPPRDLLLRKQVLNRCVKSARRLAENLRLLGPVILGCPWVENLKVFNAACFLEDGQIKTWIGKTLLPNYDVFDEQRYFTAFTKDKVVENKWGKLGLTICEDIWNDKEFEQRAFYSEDPVAELANAQVNVLINLSASPFTVGKQEVRQKMLAYLSKKYSFPVVYVNQVGANDDLIFPGRSMVFNANGEMVYRASSFKEEIAVIDIYTKTDFPEKGKISREEDIFRALALGVSDYVKKCGFNKVVLGLSGGIDSSLTAVIAVEALGSKNVLGVLMPSCFTSKESNEDALQLAKTLGINTYVLPIEDIRQSFVNTLHPIFKGLPEDVTEENIQARIRGNLLMAISNKLDALLLTTGNKSELAVGYCTIYGDMSGGLAVIADVPKTMVYKVCKWLNREEEIIPSRVLVKPPSAELRPNQKDEDNLPPYEILDKILEFIVEKNMEPEEIIKLGYEETVVQKIYRMVRIAEFKRKQAPPGLKVTDRAFGTGWRMPIAAKI
ncbi:NAD+ synthase [Desulfonauticus submarinus]